MSEPTYTPGADTAETLGNVAHPYAERLIKKVVGYFADSRPIKALIRDLDPDTIALLYQGLPGIGGLLVSRIPDGAFKTVEAANMVRTLGLEASKAIADVLKEKKDASEEELISAVDEAIKRVEEMQVLVDQMDHYHMPDCAKVAKLAKRFRTEIAFKAAVDQGLKPAACCYERVEASKAKAADGHKASNRKFRSPLEVVGAMDEEQRRKFTEWLEGLSADERNRVMDDLHELDSMEEFIGFMALDPAVRIEMLPLLENRNAKHAVKRFLGKAGTCVQLGLSEVLKALKAGWKAYREWDDGFAPKVTEAKRTFNVPRAERKPKKKVKWSLKKMFGLF